MKEYLLSLKDRIDELLSIENAEWPDAFRRSPVRSLELVTFDNQETERLTKRKQALQDLISAGLLRIKSIHLPPLRVSNLDETIRKKEVAELKRVMAFYQFTGCRHFTLHPSVEDVPDNDPARSARVEALRRTIRELLPLLDEYQAAVSIEYLPRQTLGNNVSEILEIVKDFPENRVGICLDVNHVMDHYAELPQIIEALSPRLKAFHLSDYDGVDENHWYVGLGIIDWDQVMKSIRALPQDLLLILETEHMVLAPLCLRKKASDPYFILRQAERQLVILENYSLLHTMHEETIQRIKEQL